METVDILALLPLLILALTPVVVMLGVAVVRSHRATFWLTMGGLVLALLSLVVAMEQIPRQVTPLLVIDGFALFFATVLLVTATVIALLSYRYWQACDCNPEEFYILLLLATLGSIVLVGSSHFASFFLGLEILSVSLYAMIAYTYDARFRIEAGLKYLILAAASSAILLFGIALLYAGTGTLSFADLAAGASNAPLALVMLGAGGIVAGVAFKLALVPFHLWTPDVYQGAPLPATTFIATVSKGGMFALVLRLFTQFGIGDYPMVVEGFAALAILSMLLGNLLALLQDNLKRMLAYSSIAHMGYLLVPFVAVNVSGQQAIAFYLVAYIASSLLGFGIMTVLSSWQNELEAVDDYRGLFWRNPWLAVGMAAALFSLAGLPPTVGLTGKFFLAAAGVEAAIWLPLLALIVGSVIGVFYYARVAIALFFSREEEETPPLLAMGTGNAAVLGVLAVIVVILGVYPMPLLRLIGAVMGRIV
ncbi:MAG: NADH-quinone oxidoreductase subunit N [Chloroflexota bacterium]